MNIKELAEQAGIKISNDWGEIYTGNAQLERFAELIRQDEREACAKLLESTDLANAGEHTGFIANMLFEFAKAIRARSNHE